MASYGFMTTSSAGQTPQWQNPDPYAGTQSSAGLDNQRSGYTAPQYNPYAGMSNSPYSGTSGSDPYAGLQDSQPAFPRDPGFAGPSIGLQYGTGTKPGYGSTPSSNAAIKAPMPTFNYEGMGNAAAIGMPTGWDNSIEAWQNPKAQEAMMSYTQAGLPGQIAANNQFNQNREFDFNSRYQQAQFGQTQWRDQQQNNLSWDERALQRELAGDARNQWGQEFNRGVFQDDRNFGRSVYTDDRDFSRGAFESDRGYNFDVTQADRRYGLDTGRLNLDTMSAQDLNRYRMGTLGVDRMEAGTSAARQRADAAYQTGQLSLGQYQAEMDRLKQTEDLAYRYGALSSNETISREQMENAYRTAVMNAVGRNQAQNVRFMRG